MWTCCQTCTPHIADDLSLSYVCSSPHPTSDFGKVKVLGGVGLVVFDLYVIPVGRSVGCFDYSAFAYRTDFGTGRSRIVCAQMRFVSLLYGMKAV